MRQKAIVAADQIEIIPDFITRQGDLDRLHLKALTAAIKTSGPLSRVLLWRDVNGPSDAPFVLLDGRYRLWAYAQADWGEGIPAYVLTCTRREAMLAATADAIKDRKNLDPHEKVDRAWRLVRDPDGAFSKAEIARATGVGSATVGRMRARWRDMIASDSQPTGHWWRDMREIIEVNEGERRELTDVERARIISERVPKVRDGLDYRTWKPAIPDDDTTFDIIEAALGPLKFRAMVDRYLGGDEPLCEAWRDEWREGDHAEAQVEDEEPNF